jgi:serine phosphatase RsbU (regulator of sigma subunit)
MGQLRTSLRTLLVDTCSAHEAVQALLDFVQWTLPGQVATLTVAILDPVTGVVENVSLGHPPLLVVEADGSARWTPKAGAPPLGLAKVAPPVRRVEVPAGGTLVLYSDGLVERRDESIVDGLERLAASFAAARTTDVDVVVRTTRDERSADDATLLVIHRED